MNPALRWRAEFYKLGPGTAETVVGHVDGDAKTVATAQPPAGTFSRLKLLTPPDIRLGDHVRYDNGEVEPFVAIVTRVGKPYESGTFNVDLSADGGGQTVFCENCTVVFRPRFSLYKIDEVDALIKASPNGVILNGRGRSKVAELFKGSDGLWTAKFPHPIGSMTFESQWDGLRDALRCVNAWLFAEPVKVGDSWTETINQGRRDVEVVAVKKLRYRIEYEMPNAGMVGSWQRGILIGGKLYA